MLLGFGAQGTARPTLPQQPLLGLVRFGGLVALGRSLSPGRTLAFGGPRPLLACFRFGGFIGGTFRASTTFFRLRLFLFRLGCRGSNRLRQRSAAFDANLEFRGHVRMQTELNLM